MRTKVTKQKPPVADAHQVSRGASTDSLEPSEPEMMDISMVSSVSGMENLLDTTLLGFGPGELSELEASYKGDSSSKVGLDVADLILSDHPPPRLQEAAKSIPRTDEADVKPKACLTDGSNLNCGSHYHKVPPPEDYQLDVEKHVERDNAALSDFYYNKEEKVHKYLLDMYDLPGADSSPDEASDPFFGVPGRVLYCWSDLTD